MSKRVIVIGSGFGGMVAALHARARGYEATVIDRCPMLGGGAQVFEQGGFRHDAGPTVITASFLFEELVALFGKKMAESVRLVRPKPWCWFQFPDGTSFAYGGTLEETQAAIDRIPPGHRAGYLALLAESKAIFAVGFEQLAAKSFDRAGTMVALLPQLVRLGGYRTVGQFVCRHIKDPRLRRAFSVSLLLVGGNGRVGEVKTEYSHDHVPVHESLLKILHRGRVECARTEEGWDVSQSTFEQTLLLNRDPESISAPFLMPRRAMPGIRRSCGRVMRRGWAHSERQEGSHPCEPHSSGR